MSFVSHYVFSEEAEVGVRAAQCERWQLKWQISIVNY